MTPTLAEARKLFALALEAELPPTVRLTPEELRAAIVHRCPGCGTPHSDLDHCPTCGEPVADEPAHCPDRSGQCFPDDCGTT